MAVTTIVADDVDDDDEPEYQNTGELRKNLLKDSTTSVNTPTSSDFTPTTSEFVTTSVITITTTSDSVQQVPEPPPLPPVAVQAVPYSSHPHLSSFARASGNTRSMYDNLSDSESNEEFLQDTSTSSALDET